MELCVWHVRLSGGKPQNQGNRRQINNAMQAINANERSRRKSEKKETRSSQAFLLQLIRLCEYYEFRFVCLDREKSEAELKRNALESEAWSGIVVGDSKYVVIAGCRHILCALFVSRWLDFGYFSLISVWRTIIIIE